jgi:tetratricopeptide (TPR) repeat protein
MTGQYEEALAAATRALEEARALPHHQSEAELLLLIAACKRELDNDAVARVSYEEAFAASEAAGNDSLAALSAAMIALELGDTLADPRGAERWLAIAKGILEREGRDDRAAADILEVELTLLSNQGHADRTLPLRGRLVELLERVYGASHPRVAVALTNRASDLLHTGQFEDAVVELRKAIAMQELMFGPDVPMLSIYYNNLGSALTEAGRYAEARSALDRALSLVAPLGPTNAHNVLPLTSLAQLQNVIGDHDAAQATAERGIAIVQGTGDSEIRFLPALLVQQGQARLARGDAAHARESCMSALAVEEKQELLAPDKIQPEGQDALTCLGQAEMALGQPEAALAFLERGETLSKREMPSELGLARFALALALVAGRHDLRRARELAAGASHELHATPGMERAAGEVDAWLAANAAP